MSLNDLKQNEIATIKKINFKGLDKRRLLDLGLVNGTSIKSSFTAPFGNPVAYEVCDTIISLRKEEAAKIEVILIG